MAEQGMKRHELWRKLYRERRYLRHLSQEELNKRLRDLVLNLLMLSPKGQGVGILDLDEDGGIWLEKWTHALEEMVLRHGPYPNGFTRDILHQEPFPNFANEVAAKAVTAMSSLGLERNQVFIKYGKREYMQGLYETGRLRVQPASFFSKSGHNGAIRDDELILPVSFALSREDMLHLVANPQDVPADAAEQRLDFEFIIPTDYWLYCVTNSVGPRLFVDFEADTCVIIRDRDAFRRRITEAMAVALPGAVMREGAATYIDPMLPHVTDIFVPMAKHFGYSYQDEYRFCWMPVYPTEAPFTHIDIEIGSLKDIAEIVAL